MHLENPVEHGDIDTNYDYLSKPSNLWKICSNCIKQKQLFPSLSKLLSLYNF
jgi:hypothetical protein